MVSFKRLCTLVRKWLICTSVLGFVAFVSLDGAIVFSDSFDTGPAPEWGNEIGSWSVSNGTYSATVPGNYPNAHSSLPFDLIDFAVDVDIGPVGDGGVWLRSAPAGGTSLGRSGVLLITKYSSLYWHIIPTGTGYGASYSSVSGFYNTGDTIHLRIEVVGDTYSAFINGSETPASTITTSQFASGQVALYEMVTQSFDNVSISIIPEPSAAALVMGIAVTFLALLVRRKRAITRG